MNCKIIIEDIINKELGVPDPLDHVLFVAILWFVLYVPSKILYNILHICYGESPKYQESKSGPAIDPSVVTEIMAQIKELESKLA